MNIAFPALLIFVIALPGIIVRYAYRTGPAGSWKNPFYIESITDEIAWSLVLAAALHSAWIAAATALGYGIDLQAALSLLVVARDDQLHSALEAASSSAPRVGVYFFTLYAVSFLVGVFTHRAVRVMRLDHRFPFLRFNNPWFYLLSGEVLDFPDVEELLPCVASSEPVRFDVVKVSAAVEQGGAAYLYSGRLVDFEFDRKGELQRLMIDEAARRPLANDRNSGQAHMPSASDDPRYYRIEGRFFVIQYADVRTLNVEYLELVDSPARETSTDRPDQGTEVASPTSSAAHKCAFEE